jgi:hypothetical protein
MAARSLRSAVCLVLLVLVAGCGGAGEAVEPSGAPVAYVTLPDAGTEPVLRVGRATFSEADLSRLGVRRVALYEPFQKRRMGFDAVPLRAVLDAAGAKSPTAVLHAVALNDYVVDLPARVARGDGVYLALRDGNGRRIATEDGGPLRVVFADDAEGAAIDNYWIWSLATVDVR